MNTLMPPVLSNENKLMHAALKKRKVNRSGNVFRPTCRSQKLAREIYFLCELIVLNSNDFILDLFFKSFSFVFFSSEKPKNFPGSLEMDRNFFLYPSFTIMFKVACNKCAVENRTAFF